MGRTVEFDVREHDGATDVDQPEHGHGEGVEEGSGRGAPGRAGNHVRACRLGRAEVPRVPRHFSGASRLGQGDGKAFMNAFADPERGLRSLIVACEGDTRVAETLFQALCALAGMVAAGAEP